MSNASSTQQYLDIQREQIRINSTLNLLRKFYNNCKHSYTKVLTSDYVKEKSLPHQLIAVIQNKGLVKVKGTGAGKTFLWVSTHPTEEMAENCWREAIRIRAEYEVNKARERRGETPNRLQIGSRQLIKLLNPTSKTPESVLKKQPTTVTEVNVMKMLKITKMFLTTGQHVMDFASLCLHKGISTKWEKAMLKTVVGKINNKGYEWIGSEDIDYDMVRNVIDISKTISETELDIPTPVIFKTEEPKTEFEKVIEKTNESTDNSRRNQRLFRLFSMLQEIHTVLNDKYKTAALSSYCYKHKLPDSMVSILKDLKIIIKDSTKGYIWIGEQPSKDMTEIVNDTHNEKYREMKKASKASKTVKDSVTLNNKDVINDKVVLSNILTEVKDDKKEKIMKLAEKFTKVGNYEMAEQLLDQII